MKPKTVVLITVVVATALFIGIPVPKRQPYISLSIKTNEDMYYVGDEIQIKYCIVNRMPFSVRLEPITYLETSFHANEDPPKGVRQVSNRTGESRGDEIYLTPFQVDDRDVTVTFIASRETDYILYMRLEAMEAVKTIQVKPRGSIM